MRRFIFTVEIDMTHNTLNDVLGYVRSVLHSDFDAYTIKHMREVQVIDAGQETESAEIAKDC